MQLLCQLSRCGLLIEKEKNIVRVVTNAPLCIITNSDGLLIFNGFIAFAEVSFPNEINRSHSDTRFSATAFVTAALQFRIWPQHELQTVLVLTPTLVLVGLFMLFFFIEAVVRIDEANYASVRDLSSIA